jgi:hypothetical protein
MLRPPMVWRPYKLCKLGTMLGRLNRYNKHAVDIAYVVVLCLMLSDMKPSCLADLQEDSRCPPPSMVSQSMILSQPHTPLVPQTYFNLSAPPSTEILERSHPARKRQVLILNNTKDQNIATDWIHNLYIYSTGISKHCAHCCPNMAMVPTCSKNIVLYVAERYCVV